MTAIFKREFRSYFTTPLGYIFLAVFYLFEGFFFAALFGNGSPSVEIIFPSVSTVVILVVPVLTMRLLSEDRRQKVDQALLTAPVTVTGIIMGKFCAALCVFALAFAPTILFQFVVSLLAEANWLVFLNALLGTLLVGAGLIAIGMFISSLTESPIISAILTLITFLLLMMLPNMMALVETEVTLGAAWLDWLASALSAVLTFLVGASGKIAFVNLIANFSGSVFHIVDVVYLVSVSAIFVFLSIRMVERRRWA